jgi:hypothetical protein
MTRDDLLQFAETNPSPEQIEQFILANPRLGTETVDALRLASSQSKMAKHISDEFFRALDEEHQTANLFRALDRA